MHGSLSNPGTTKMGCQKYSPSLFQAGLDPWGEGSAARVLRLHSALFSTSIRSTCKSSMLYFTTSIHLFLCLLLSVVHVRLPPRFSWHNPPLLGVVHAQTISTWPPVLCPWCTLHRGCDEYHHSFSCLSAWGRESILAFSFQFSPNVLLHAFSMSMFLNHRSSYWPLPLFCILSL